MTAVLGISAYYHDSAAALLVDGKLIAAAQEERFSRIRHDPAFPAEAIRYCISKVDEGEQIDYIAFYDKPFLKFERIIETSMNFAPRGFLQFAQAMPIWVKEKLFLKSELRGQLSQLLDCKKTELPPLLFSQHHQSHAASAFYCSPFEEAVILCVDGVGEWATTSAWHGNGKGLEPLWQIDFPHSLGLLYSAFTYFCGFKVNSGEYKLMGLAPFGTPRYADLIKSEIIDIKADGSFRLNLDYFDFCTGLRMTSRKFDTLFGGPARQAEAVITKREMDLAASIQVVTEEILILIGQSLRRETGCEQLCLAGGVALNCVANGRLLKSGLFEDIWVQPAAGDSGGAVGAAFNVFRDHLKLDLPVTADDAMRGCLLGPAYSDGDVRDYLQAQSALFEEMPTHELCQRVSTALDEGKVIGWFQGAMEFGPRALGSRSILGDARNPDMQERMNLKIKFRESFRPFAPAVLAEDAGNYFDIDCASPYMLFTAELLESLQDNEPPTIDGLDQIRQVRSSLPAITHLDYSARVQTVDAVRNPKFHQLLEQFKKLTGCSVVINTSFNVRGEPIVNSPEDAYHCFMGTDMDYLAIGNFLVAKPAGSAPIKREFEKD